MKVLRLSTSQKKYGGNIYETMVDIALEAKFDYVVDSFRFRLKGKWRLLEVPFYFWHQYVFAKDSSNIRVRSFQSAYFNYRGPGLSIIYHIDSSYSPFLSQIFQNLTEKIFFWRNQKEEMIVVISDYWQRFMQSRGYRNINLIYCGYVMSDYEISETEMNHFKKRFHLEGSKIIYIGNLLKKKGADLVYEQLKDEGYLLVTTGEKDLDLPVLHLQLGFKDYLCLLKSSAVVVTFSQFLEGWNRVAHEAMLVGTPVVGSGVGGMEELLIGGGQIICREAMNLRPAVCEAQERRAELVSSGKAYAQTFSAEKFNHDWQELIRKLGTNK